MDRTSGPWKKLQSHLSAVHVFHGRLAVEEEHVILVRKRAHEIGTWNSTGLQCGFGRGWTTISPFNSTALDIVVSVTPDGKVFRIHSQRKKRKAAISGDLSGRYVRLGKSAHGIRVSPRDAEEDATRRRATADVYRGSSGARTRITWTDRIARVEQREDGSRYFYGGDPPSLNSSREGTTDARMRPLITRGLPFSWFRSERSVRIFSLCISGSPPEKSATVAAYNCPSETCINVPRQSLAPSTFAS